MDAEREEYINYQNFILTTIMGAFLSVFENTKLETPPLYPNITNQIVTKTLRLCNASCG